MAAKCTRPKWPWHLRLMLLVRANQMKEQTFDFVRESNKYGVLTCLLERVMDNSRLLTLLSHQDQLLYHTLDITLCCCRRTT